MHYEDKWNFAKTVPRNDLPKKPDTNSEKYSPTNYCACSLENCSTMADVTEDRALFIKYITSIVHVDILRAREEGETSLEETMEDDHVWWRWLGLWANHFRAQRRTIFRGFGGSWWSREWRMLNPFRYSFVKKHFLHFFFGSRQKRVALKAKNFQKHVHILNWYVSNYMKFTMSHFVIIQSSRDKTIHIFTFWRRKVEWIFFRSLKPSLQVSASLRLRQWTQPHSLRRVFQARYLLRP